MTDSLLPALDAAIALPGGDLVAYVRDYQQASEEGDDVGASRALDALCRAVAPDLAKFCAYIAGPRVNPMDATQETLLEVCRRLSSLRDPSAVRPWLYSVARNKVLAQRRWSWVRRWMPGVSLDGEIDPSVGPYREVRLGRRAQLVEEILEHLPEEHRTALALHLMQGLSDSEVAECLGRKKTNAKSLIRRAKESFRKQAKKMGCERELAETLAEDEEGLWKSFSKPSTSLPAKSGRPTPRSPGSCARCGGRGRSGSPGAGCGCSPGPAGRWPRCACCCWCARPASPWC